MQSHLPFIKVSIKINFLFPNYFKSSFLHLLKLKFILLRYGCLEKFLGPQLYRDIYCCSSQYLTNTSCNILALTVWETLVIALLSVSIKTLPRSITQFLEEEIFYELFQKNWQCKIYVSGSTCAPIVPIWVLIKLLLLSYQCYLLSLTENPVDCVIFTSLF